jgi:hypothetical protein
MATHTTPHPSPTHLGTTSGTGRTSRFDAARILPLVLEANAATSLAAGLIGLADGRWSADRLGLADATWVRVVGAGLIAFALAVGLASRLGGRSLARAARLISTADLAWVAATVVVLEATVLSTSGAVIAAVMGIGVLDFALAQLWLARRLGQQADHQAVSPVRG